MQNKEISRYSYTHTLERSTYEVYETVFNQKSTFIFHETQKYIIMFNPIQLFIQTTQV